MTDLRPRRLLALDGGGAKGLTSLLILRRLMHTIKVTENLAQLPRPCDYFDLICGTSTGRLIAIILGRLGMGVEECVDAYRKLAGDVFGQKRKGGKLRKLFNALRGSAWFKSTKLEQVIKNVIQKKCLGTDIPLLSPAEQKCKVFVCAIRVASVEHELLRTYPSNMEDYECMLWEAARATSAAPLFFKPIRFQRSKAVFADGAMQINNPIRALINEAGRIWPNVPVGCVISIGTGWGKVEELGQRLDQVLLTCAKISTDAQREAESFVRDHQGKTLWEERKYFRFNVQQGIQEMQLDDASNEDLEKLDARNKAYLNQTTTAAEIGYCAKRLFDPLSPLTSWSEITMNPSVKSFEMLPLGRDPQFVGRDEILENMDEVFKSPLHSRLALVGLGGVGKTQIALEYAYRLRATSSQTSVFWIHAGNADRIKQAYRELAEKVKLLGREDPKADILCKVREWLESEESGNWLLVFDNLDDEALIFDKVNNTTTSIFRAIPCKAKGAVLFTTRDRAVGVKATAGGKIIDVPLMNEKDGRLLLKEKYPQANLASDDCERFLLALDYLPLAVSQAAAYLQSKCLTIAEYLRLYNENERNKVGLLSSEFNSLARYEGVPNSVITTWTISFQSLQEERSPNAADLLSLISQLDRQDIPKSILAIDSEDSLVFEENLGRLKAFAFIKTKEGNETYEIHRLVQLATRTWLKAHEKLAQWEQEAVARLSRTFPPAELFENWNICAILYPHAQIALGYSMDKDISLLHQASLLYETARYCLSQGSFKDGLEKVEKAIEVYRRFRGMDSGEVIAALFLRGILLKDLGNTSNAEKLLTDVLQKLKLKPLLKASHIDILIVTNQLASIYGEQGKWKETEELQLQVIEEMKQALGAEHPSTLKTITNLAGYYGRQEKWKEAEDLNRQVLNTDTSVLGSEDPTRLAVMANLAANYNEQGRWKEAEEIARQALEAWKHLSMAENPITLSIKYNLADAYCGQGRLDEAEELQLRVLEVSKRKQGAEHPDTLSVMALLGVIYYRQGRLEDAEKLQIQLVEARKRLLGTEHPNTLNVMARLGMVYYRQGRLEDAEKLRIQVVEARKRILGTEHPHTLKAISNLALIHDRQERRGEE